jgi:hypothetical protein
MEWSSMRYLVINYNINNQIMGIILIHFIILQKLYKIYKQIIIVLKLIVGALE